MISFFVAHEAVRGADGEVHVRAEPSLLPSSTVISVAELTSDLCRMNTQDRGDVLISARLLDVAEAFRKLAVPCCLLTARRLLASDKPEPMLLMVNHFTPPIPAGLQKAILPYKPLAAFSSMMQRVGGRISGGNNPETLMVSANQVLVAYGIQRGRQRAYALRHRGQSMAKAAPAVPSLVDASFY